VFLNIVLDDAIEEKEGGEKERLGMVVSSSSGDIMDIYVDAYAGHSRQFSRDARG